MIRGWFNMIFKSRASEEFNVESVVTEKMESVIKDCINAYRGNPYWTDEEDGIKTVNFAKAICSETARLAMLGTKITVDGSARAKWLQGEVDKIYYIIREWVEYGCAYGTVVLKPNGESVDLVTPENFMITNSVNGEVKSIVFINRETSNKKYYTRLEYHRFIDKAYVITNKCYVGKSESDKGEPIAIEKTPWECLQDEVVIQNIKYPLYGVLRMPHANNIDLVSPMGLPIFSDAMEELKDLDIAYSRNSKEIFDSKRTVLIDSDRMLPVGSKVVNSTAHYNETRKSMGLPDYVKNVWGNGQDDFYQEINPQLNTDVRLSGLNAYLSQIGYKVGYSNGYFVFNESGGIQTATEVEANDRRTIQLIKDVRDKIEDCMKRTIYAMNAFADLYDLAPIGTYEAVFNFGDITYNVEEDRKRWWGYVVSGKVPAWKYFEKFEGMSEEEAKEMIAEAQPKQPTLFGGEE